MTRIVRIHVGISRELQLKFEAGTIAVTDFTRTIGLSKVDTGKLRDFGILTGEAEAERLEDMRRRTGVDFVEEDQARGAL